MARTAKTNQKQANPLLPLDLRDHEWRPCSRAEALTAVQQLRHYHETGLLGGSTMPEDAHPAIDASSADSYHYFTLSMALNYQRNSYVLWQCATRTYLDPECQVLFRPAEVAKMPEGAVRDRLLRHKLALQPQRHTKTWSRLAQTIVDLLDGDVRNLFRRTGSDAGQILDFVQKTHKGQFPCLAGAKICNYWLYVMQQYSDCNLTNRHALNIAPDTHVIQATIR